MAKVVLENVHKSFPNRNQDSATVPIAGETLGISTKKTPVARSKSRSTAVSILRSINLTVEDGEFMVLVGPSGCGKSTLLRSIAGLEELTGGNIFVGDRKVNNLAPKERDIAMVFQNYALYPHLKVYDNLAFGLRRKGAKLEQKYKEKFNAPQSSIFQHIEDLLVATTRSLPKQLRYISKKEKFVNRQVREVAKLLQIESLLNRFPKQLSGGQKQRVALGRAIARNPQVFLMDEPLSNLDAKLRAETRAQIVKLQRQLGVTTIYVTHDQTEAMTMGSRIAVMDRGHIQQIAPPLEIYNRPANRFVAEFIGSPPMNFIEVEVRTPLSIANGEFRTTLPEVWKKSIQPYQGRSVLLGIRPEHLTIKPPAPKNIPVEIDSVEALGNDTYISGYFLGDLAPNEALRNRKTFLQARVSPDFSVRVGEEIWLSLDLDKIHLFDPKTEKTIWLS
ncbi:MAG: ATP-binding cassette domain-containing protein [Prochloraceae cyanobacterium]|nr:ATP-binding cassette domain-containing protein [Prochloraceae cyanobacterium]